MNAVVIGSGNVATHLSIALHRNGVQILQVWSKQVHHAEALATLVDAQAITDFSTITHEADICFISVKDDAIAEVATQLEGFKGVVVHTAGSVDLTVFEGKVDRYGVFYPLQTFSKAKEVDFKSVPLCLEANSDRVMDCLSTFANLLSDKVFKVSSDQRRILHLAAVFACNFVNHLYSFSAELLAKNNLPFDIIKPLILETASKIKTADPSEVQTGPAIRNDLDTLKKHELLLADDPHLLNIYEILSDSIKKTKK